MSTPKRSGPPMVAAAVCAAAIGLGLSSCGGGGGSPGASSKPAPSWAAGLGRGVKVVAPALVNGGHDSPAAAVQGEVDALIAGGLPAACAYLEPAVQAACSSAVASAPSGSAATFQDFAIGYVAIDGSQALVGTTGTDCDPNQTPSCATNKDPAAIFSTGLPFATLYSQAIAANSSNSTGNSYSLLPCVRVGSEWYLFQPDNSS